MSSGDEKWQHYHGFRGYYPTDEELSTIKLIILPGSGHAVYNLNIEWIPKLQAFIKRVMNNYPHIKWLGGCFGEQAIAHTMGGLVEKRPLDPK